MKNLSQHDVVGNCRAAFDAAEILGIPRVIEPRDMSLLAIPDKLAVMTYLYQLRAHFTGHQLQIEQIGNTSDESSYVIGNYKTDNSSSQSLIAIDHLKKQLTQQNSLEDNYIVDEKSPLDKKDVKNLLLSGSKQFLVKVLSPVREKQISNPNCNKASPTATVDGITKPLSSVVTQREGNDSLGSGDDNEKQNSQVSNSAGSPHNQKLNSNSNVTEISPPSFSPTTTDVCKYNT